MKIRCPGNGRNSVETATKNASPALGTCASVHTDGTVQVRTNRNKLRHGLLARPLGAVMYSIHEPSWV